MFIVYVYTESNFMMFPNQIKQTTNSFKLKVKGPRRSKLCRGKGGTDLSIFVS